MSNTPLVVPHNIEAEQALLGAVFVDNDVLDDVRSIVRSPQQFYRGSHQHIFDAMCRLREAGHEIDWIHVAAAITKAGHLEACGGKDLLDAYLVEISNGVPSAYGAEGYATMVRDRWVMRELVHAGGDIRAMGLDQTRSPVEVIEMVERKVFELAEARFSSDIVDFLDVFNAVVEQQKKMVEFHRGNPDKLPGLSTGLSDLDQMTNGHQGGELVIIGGRPGQGKTSLLLLMAEALAMTTHERRDDGKGGSLVFSLEMPREQLVQRLWCGRAHIDLRRLQRGSLTNEELVALSATQKELAGRMQIHIDDNANIRVSEMRSKARRYVRQYGVECIFVDYLQLMKDDDRLDRHLQIANITRGLKLMARELNVPVVAGAQLNRGVEQRNAKMNRPQLMDLRESGSQEQDADKVYLLWPDQDPQYDSQPCQPYKICVAKQRNGPTGDVDVLFEKRAARFLAAAKPKF
jgi:replicative DNA helicase